MLMPCLGTYYHFRGGLASRCRFGPILLFLVFVVFVIAYFHYASP